MAPAAPPIKGAALRVPFPVWDYSGNLLVGATFGVLRVDKDFGGQNVAVNTVVSEGNGAYSLQLTAAEMNADMITVLVPVTGYADLVIEITTAAYNFDTVIAGLLDLADGIEVGLTLRQAHRLEAAAAAAKLSGAATNTVTIRNAVADSKDRIVATVDASGNRTAVVTDLT